MNRIVPFLVLASLIAPSVRADFADRWFYVSRNFTESAHVDEVKALLGTAQASGYNGMLLAGVPLALAKPERTARLLEVKRCCEASGIELIPIIWSVGYGGGNPAYSAARACTNLRFRVKGGKAVLVRDGTARIANGGFEDAPVKPNRAPSWLFTDKPGTISFVDAEVAASGRASLRMENFAADAHGHGRASAALKVTPGHRYRVSGKIRTDNLLPAGKVKLQVYTKDGRQICVKSPNLAPTVDWTTVTCDFDAGELSDYIVYFGVWGGTSGRLWIDDVGVEDIGIPVPIIREGLDFTVREAASGTPCRPGVDYRPPANGWMPDGTFEVLPGGRLRDGDELVVDCWSAVIVAGGQRPCCMSAPALYESYRQSAAAIAATLNPRKWFLSMDEIRGGGTCALCLKRNTDMAHLLADCIAKQREIIRAVRPDAEIYIWNDMLDPTHNAHDGYFLCRGTFAGVWDLIPKDLIISCWGGKPRVESMQFFSSRGFRTQGAAYYDVDDLEDSRAWVDLCRRTPNCTGVMYTSWRNRYGLLRPFGELLK